MLLKLREDNSNFSPARSLLCLWGFPEIFLTVVYCTYLLQFYGSQMLENPIDIFLHVNEFIMPVVLQNLHVLLITD